MFEDYLWLFLTPIIGLVITATCMTIWINFPKKLKSKKTKAKSKYYGPDYYKAKQFPDISDALQKELAKRNHKL